MITHPNLNYWYYFIKLLYNKIGVFFQDKTQNTKIIFSDNEDETPKQKQNSGITLNNNNNRTVINTHKKNAMLFEDDDDGEEDVNFEIKKQFEGKKGQKVKKHYFYFTCFILSCF